MNRTKLSSLVLVILGLCAGCVKQSTFDKVQTQLAETQKQLADTQAQLSDVQQQLAATNAQVGQVQSQLVKARAMPVRVTFRYAKAGPGAVAVLTPKVNRERPRTVGVASHAFGTTMTYQLILPAMGAREIGHGQGSPIEAGDQIRVSSPDFEPLVVTYRQR
jgi:uncharacterized protein (DUF885 family)